MPSARKALDRVGRARLDLLAARIDYLTRAAAPDDPAVCGIVGRYLGVPADSVKTARSRMEFGQAARALAEERSVPAADARRGREDGGRAAGRSEGTAILLGLIAGDLEREAAADISRPD